MFAIDVIYDIQRKTVVIEIGFDVFVKRLRQRIMLLY